MSLWHLGFPDQAMKVNRDVCQLARENGHPFSLAYCLHHTAWLFQFFRMGDEVQAAAAEQVAIATEQGFALWQATGTFFKGAGLLLQGQPAESLPLLRKGLDDFRSTGAEILRPFQLSVLGDAYTQAGRFDEAHVAIDEGLALVEKNDDRIQEAELHRLKGVLVLTESPEQTCCGRGLLFTRAIKTARAPAEQGVGTAGPQPVSPASGSSRGRLGDAQRILAAVAATYTERRTTPDLVEAKALLETLA